MSERGEITPWGFVAAGGLVLSVACAVGWVVIGTIRSRQTDPLVERLNALPRVGPSAISPAVVAERRRLGAELVDVTSRHAHRSLVLSALFLAGLALWMSRRVPGAVREWTRPRRRKNGQCEGCGYDLRGIGGRCPECGNEISEKQCTAGK
jgi:hypothetical protein